MIGRLNMHCLHVRERALTTMALLATVLSASMAPAQVDTDFPTYMGNNARQGRANDVGPGSGSTSLRWYNPSSLILSRILDNVDVDATDPDTTAKSGPLWVDPINITVEALFPYFQFTAAGTLASPIHDIAFVTPATTDPTKAQVPANLSTFEWRFTVQSGLGGHFAPYVWLPSGPAEVGGQQVFPQQYFVYQVLVNGIVQMADVVDTYSAGNGWVRLGAGGRSNDIVVAAKAGDVVIIRLLNTTPLKADGTPTNPTGASFVVYADAAQIASTSGSMIAPPTVMTVTRGTETIPQVVAARNQILTGVQNGVSTIVSNAVISAYRFNGRQAANTQNNVDNYWTYPLSLSAGGGTTIDNNPGAVRTGAGFASSTAGGIFTGADYYVSNLVTDQIDANGNRTEVAPTADVRYTPNIPAGEYEVWAFLQGDQTPTGTRPWGVVTYEIHEGTAVTEIEVDQNQIGWVRVGGTTFTESAVAPLDVRVTNHSELPADATKLAYADAIMFVGQSDVAVNSAPVQAVVGIRKWVPDANGQPQLGPDNKPITAVVQTPVVIIADSQGVLHCIDAIGNANGTTNTYWTYPSVRDQNYADWVDPNVIENLDGKYDASKPASANVVTAVMPTNFDTSSAVVQRIGTTDYLFIGSQNGRVYSINMEGRGDYGISRSTFATGTVSLNGLPGTTSRNWTFPSDPLDEPIRQNTVPLGPIIGSVTYATTTLGPTLFIPDSNGRMYAVDAVGDGNRKTHTYDGWPYPALDKPLLGQIVTTPNYEFGKLFFGTLRKDTGSADADEGKATLYALTDAGEFAWTPQTSITLDPTTSIPASTGTVNFSDFRCSMVTAPAAAVDDTDGVNYLFALNDNGYIFALNADTGSLLWSNFETSVSSRTALGFTRLTGAVPAVTVSGTNGRFVGYRAHKTLPIATLSRVLLGKRLVTGEELTPAAFATGQGATDASLFGWLYFGSRNGTLYAFADGGASGSYPDPNGDAPFIEEGTDPNAVYYTKTKFHYVDREQYRKLQGLLSDRPTYGLGTTEGILARTAFDWGETAYVLIYDFPYQIDAGSNPPIVNVEISIDGKVVRTLPAAALRWVSGAPLFSQALPVTAPLDPDPVVDGYAVAQFTFQGGGQNALPPGTGRVSVSITTGGRTNRTPPSEIDLASDPLYRNGDFGVLNPIGIEMVANPAARVKTDTLGVIGEPPAAGDPLLPQLTTNGSQDIGTRLFSRLATSPGFVPMGQSQATRINIYDRSLMWQIRPPGIGLDNIRVQLHDLKWQFGVDNLVKPLDENLYPRFEDKPINFPNTSLDYPDMGAERIQVTKDPAGQPENPVTFKVQLIPSTPNVGDVVRRIKPTPFEFAVSPPKYQPPSSQKLTLTDSLGSTDPNRPVQGYYGRISVFVDSLDNGILDTVAAREAYRSFNLMANVAPSHIIVTTTPDVSLGSLASGTGYSPISPGFDPVNTPYNPWPALVPTTGPNWSDAYQEFMVRNEGNVNVLNAHLALSAAQSPAAPKFGWPFTATTNDPLAWLNGGLDLWTNINPPFAMPNPFNPGLNRVIIQKPRVEDRVGTEMMPNPSRRDGEALNPSNTSYPATTKPRLAVSIPLGFPSGTYESLLRVIDDDPSISNDNLNWNLNPEEPAADPALHVRFTVRETRLTTRSTARTAPMVEDLTNLMPDTTKQYFPPANLQPTALRDNRGALVMAWASNRSSSVVNPVPLVPQDKDLWRIYVGSVNNNYPAATVGVSPLYDLNYFRADAATGRWFSDQTPNGYPNLTDPQINALFGADQGEGFEDARFHSPSFPIAGTTNLFFETPDNRRIGTSSFMAFVGEATHVTSAGRENQSLILFTPVFVNTGGLVRLQQTPIALPDRSTKKGRPTVVMNAAGNGAYVFYPGTSGGTTGIYWSYFNGTSFGQTYSLGVGPGFDSIGSPSAFLRKYRGANTEQYGNQVIDMVFEGKLRGRTGTEVYMGRLPVDAQGNPGRFAFLPLQTNERLVNDPSDSNRGLYRARGLDWDTTGAPVQLVLVNKQSGAQTVLFDYNPNIQPPVLSPSTAVFDRQAGLISLDSKLGGKLTIDPSQGTIRLSSGGIPRDAELVATYRPAFLRMSPVTNGAGYVAPTVVYDDHFVTSDALNPQVNRPIPYWFHRGGTQVIHNDNRRSPDLLTNDRYVVFYNGASASANQSARPLMNTMRLGVRLPFSLIDPISKNVVRLTVSGNSGPYEIDPAKNRVYFTALDEDRPVTISNQFGTTDSLNGTQVNVGFVQETDQQDVPIEQAANESGLTAFVDPLVLGSTPNMLRPPLIWLFWTSTRAGNVDVYFQTIAPHIAPGAKAP